jgi:hypothetical protein
MRKTTLWCLIGVVLVGLGGCSRAISPGGIPAGSTLTLSGLSTECVFCAAQSAVTRNYRLDVVDSDRGIIKTLPQEYQSLEAPASMVDVVVPSQRTFRRIVTIQVRPMGERSTSVAVRVDLERRDTIPMEAFAYQRQADDRPDQRYKNTATALDKEKREVWTSVRRDTQTERDLLNCIEALAQKDCKLPPPVVCPAE